MLKALKKQNNMLFSIAKQSGLNREIKNTKKIKSKASKKHSYSISDISSSDYDASLSSDIDSDRRIHPNERK